MNGLHRSTPGSRAARRFGEALPVLAVFYKRVPGNPLLAPVFAQMSPEHVEHVSAFVAEVFGGPKRYSQELGGHGAMLRKHQGRGLSNEKRQRWMQLLLACADECGVPDDPEFRTAFIAYLEWGMRLAMLNSQPGADLSGEAPMPAWSCGVVRGPYIQPG